MFYFIRIYIYIIFIALEPLDNLQSTTILKKNGLIVINLTTDKYYR